MGLAPPLILTHFHAVNLLYLPLAGLFLGSVAHAADPSGFESDDFSAVSLDSGIWTVVDPVGDGTVAVNGSQLLLTVPAGTEHNVWTAGNDALRVMQPVNDTDFELEIKFESAGTEQVQMQGILIEQDADDFIRFDFFSDGSNTRIYAATFTAGSPTQRVNRDISSGSPLYMRVKREGDQWTQSFSVDGVVWNPAVSFSYPLVVTSVGAYAGNAGSLPAHTAVIDYFFSTASPISPEDGVPISDSTAPFIRDVRKVAGLDQFQVLWSTDEPASGVVEYGLTTGYEQGQVEHTDFTATHDLQVTGLAAGNVYHFRLRSTDASGNERVSDDFEITVSANPYIDNWYGPVQNFGQLWSNSQRWINILGNVSGPNAISSLSYSLSGQASQPLSMGTDGRRLQAEGDFNAEIEYLELVDGANTVAITATDTSGNTTTENLTVNYASGNTWPLPYVADWATAAKIEDVAQIVDGVWSLEGAGVRTAQLGYDRLLSIGDISWTNYEVTVPVTLHALSPACTVDVTSNPCDGGAGLGVLVRWQGHRPTGAQPSFEWTPAGALGWYRWKSNRTEGTITPALYLTGGNGVVLVSDPSPAFPVGVTHVMKMRAETVGGQYEYKLKLWEQGQPEPTQWDLEAVQLPTDSVGNGSLLLLAHHADVTFGTVSVAEILPDTTAPAITLDPANQAVEEGQTATFSVVASGTAPLSYQWEKDGQIIPGATGDSYTTPATTLADNGSTYRVAVSNAAGTAISSAATLTVTAGPVASPLASVLPASRSVQVGDSATAFATIINAASATATGCGIAPLTSVQADFSYQTTDTNNALIGTANTPVDIAAGGSQSYVFAFTPTAPFSPLDVQLTFDCTNTGPAPTTPGLNTLLLVADSGPVPDIVALGATLTGDGIVNLSSTGAFSVATVNVGTAGSVSVSADTGSASLPVSIAMCETDPATGACINPTVPTLGPVTTSIAADATPTFSFFVTGTDTVPFDPANNRIFVRFKDASGVTRGATSVAVRTVQ